MDFLGGKPGEARKKFEKAVEIYHGRKDYLAEAEAHLMLGDLDFFEGKPDHAKVQLNKALKLYKDNEQLAGQIDAMNSLGSLAHSVGATKEALERLQKARDLADETVSHTVKVDVLISLGKVELAQGRNETAAGHLEEAAKMAGTSSYRMGEALALESLGELDSIRGDIPASRKKFGEARGLFNQMSYRLGEAQVFLREANQHVSLGEYDSAATAYKEAESLNPPPDFPRLSAQISQGLAGLNRATGEYKQALHHANVALKIFRNISGKAGEASASCMRGRIFGLMSPKGVYEAKASEAIAGCLELGREIRIPRLVANALLEQGRLHRAYGKYKEARSDFDEALRIMRKIGSVSGEANLLLLTGGLEKVSAEREDDADGLGAARANFQECAKRYVEIESLVGQANAAKELGALDTDEKRFSEAKKNLKKALGLYKKIGSRLGRAQTFDHMAALYFKQGDVEGASKNWESARKAYLELGDVGKARDIDRKAQLVQAPQKLEQGRQLFEEGKFDDAISAFIVAKVDPSAKNEALYMIGQSAVEAGHFGLALSHYQLLLPPPEGLTEPGAVAEERIAQVRAQIERLERKIGKVMAMPKVPTSLVVYVDGIKRGKEYDSIAVAAGVDHQIKITFENGEKVEGIQDKFSVDTGMTKPINF